MANKVKELTHKGVTIVIYDDDSFTISGVTNPEYNWDEVIGPIKIKTTIDVEKTAVCLVDLIFCASRCYVRSELNKLL